VLYSVRMIRALAPATSLLAQKTRRGLRVCVRTGKETADLYAPVEKHFQERSAELQSPPLRYAPVGMTKERVALPSKLDAAEDEQQVPPLRCAPVGMTLLLGIWKWYLNIYLGLGCWYPNGSVIPTGAQRSGGTCCFLCSHAGAKAQRRFMPLWHD
jgi:hypothetical protein